MTAQWYPALSPDAVEVWAPLGAVVVLAATSVAINHHPLHAAGMAAHHVAHLIAAPGRLAMNALLIALVLAVAWAPKPRRRPRPQPRHRAVTS